MTMTGQTEETIKEAPGSYLDIAEFIQYHGAKNKQDLQQLWRRIVFYIAISNTDDHLRNHGFILDSEGWVLSPAFDINPVAWGNGLKLNISETDNAQDLSLAKDVAIYFGIDKSNKVNKIIKLLKYNFIIRDNNKSIRV
jgi:serine/threonine-protein kinase HipA